MAHNEQRSRLVLVKSERGVLDLAWDAFMVSQEAARHSPLTLEWYKQRLGAFFEFLEGQGVTEPGQITPHHIRLFIVQLEQRGLKDTTIHGYAQVVKTFCRFLVNEEMTEENPMSKVAMPKVDKRILPAFAPEDVHKLLTTCHTLRDKAIVLCLLDSGLRAAEFVSLQVGDVNLQTGAIRVKHGKGAKDRVAYLGAPSRKALIKYLSERRGRRPTSPLWLSQDGGSLTYWGLALLLRRLGKRAGVEHCSPHTFRRSCALWSLRAGMSIYHLQALMGHSDLQVLRRYLDLVEADAQEAHKRYGAVDNML